MATRSANTQAESLQSVLHELQDITLMPDADLPFISSVMQLIQQYLRAPIEQMINQNGGQGMPGGGAPGQSPMPNMAGGGAPGMGPGQPIPGPPGPPMQPGVPGGGGLPPSMGNLRPDMQGPPTDEIARMIHGGH